jgi:hypothetical protein
MFIRALFSLFFALGAMLIVVAIQAHEIVCVGVGAFDMYACFFAGLGLTLEEK